MTSITSWKLYQKKLNYKISILQTSSHLQKIRFFLSRKKSQTTWYRYGTYRKETLHFLHKYPSWLTDKNLLKLLKQRKTSWPHLVVNLHLPLHSSNKIRSSSLIQRYVPLAIRKYLPKPGQSISIDAIARSQRSVKVLRNSRRSC